MTKQAPHIRLSNEEIPVVLKLLEAEKYRLKLKERNPETTDDNFDSNDEMVYEIIIKTLRAKAVSGLTSEELFDKGWLMIGGLYPLLKRK